MVSLRRLLTGLLVFAVTQFGVIAIAPAHAHESGNGHGVREIVLSHQEPAAHHHDHDDHHADHQDTVLDLSDDIDSVPPTEDGGRGEHVHVHACPQFAPISGQVTVIAPTMLREMTWPGLSVAAVTYSSSPPLRPPRTSL